MKCSKCGSENVNTQIISVNKRGRLKFSMFMQALLMNSGFILVFIPLIGWFIILFMYLRGYKIQNETWSICQNCGEKEYLE